MANIDTFLARNKEVEHTPIPYLSEIRAAGQPGAKIMIVTCLDPRCIPEKFFNLNVGEAGVHRNAGGNVRLAIRDILIIDELFELEQLIIIHHTDCGTLQYTNDSMTKGLKSRLDKEHWHDVDNLDFGANVDMEKSVKEDLEWVRQSPLIRDALKKGTQGFMFDIKTGEVKKVGTAL